MRVLILTQYFRPEPLANAEVVGALAQGLVEEGNEVHIVTPAVGGAVAGMRLHRCPGVHPKDRSSIPLRLAEYAVFSVTGFVTALRAPRPDVIIVPSPPPTLGLVGLAIARVRRVRVIYNVQDLYPEVVAAVQNRRSTGLLVSSLRRVMKRVYELVDAVVVIDRHFERLIRTATPNARVVAIRNAIDLEPFVDLEGSEQVRRDWDVAADELLVVYAGNTGRSQDLRSVVEACRSLDARLVIHGGGAAHEQLQSTYADEPMVSFSGFRPREELGRLFAAADVHVVPLRADVASSSLPSKLLSIFAAGRPAVLVAEADTAAAHLLDEVGGGWRVDPGDVDGLRVALASALQDREDRLRRGAGARRWAQVNAGPARMGAEWQNLLESVVHG